MTSALLDLLAPPESPAAGRITGVAVGIVTDNKDPDGLGRVRVRYPWLAKDAESFWARVCAPMAGKERGVVFLPEVDDEVLVAFQHGRIDAPVVVGSLWNGVDKPPVTNADGKNVIREIKSRSGHVIRLDDTADAEKIEIIDKSGNNRLVIDTKANTVTIAAEGDIVLESKSGCVALKGKSVNVQSFSDAVSVDAKTGITLKASGDVTVRGTTINLN